MYTMAYMGFVGEPSHPSSSICGQLSALETCYGAGIALYFIFVTRIQVVIWISGHILSAASLSAALGSRHSGVVDT